MGGPAEYLPPPPPLVAANLAPVTETTASGPDQHRTLEVRIQRQQTFYEAMSQIGVPHEDIMSLVASVGEFRDLRAVREGDSFRLEISTDDRLLAIAFDLDLESWASYRRSDDTSDDFTLEMGAYPVIRRTVGVSGTIESSLYEALQTAGAPLSLAAKMNDVLGWDLDFNRDPRRGDTFRIVYEQVYKNGEFIRTGSILACSYQGSSRDHAAYRYTLRDGKTGYYDREGCNHQKQLMRAPLNYSRISSGFSYDRLHPVLKRRMPHLGIDYAAPVGTPVWAAGDGVVIAKGRKKGNGRYVHIRHTNREYETLYLHFSRFGAGIKKGAKVRQGDVLGYVGASGYATGPHLDFRVKRGGRFVNPRRLKLPPAEPVPAAELASFQARRLAYEDALAESTGGHHEPVAVAALDKNAPPWWDARAHAALGLPSVLRALD